MHKVDLNRERSKEQWVKLLDAVKVNNDNYLSFEEQAYYITEIEYKLGVRNKRAEVLKDIEDGQPDYSDINGY